MPNDFSCHWWVGPFDNNMKLHIHLWFHQHDSHFAEEVGEAQEVQVTCHGPGTSELKSWGGGAELAFPDGAVGLALRSCDSL